MPQAKDSQQRDRDVFMWEMPPVLNTPFMTILAEMNGTFLETVATAQKDWVDFLHRRIKEDVAVSRQLMGCHSLADMHQVYSDYLRTAFEQYQQQSQKLVRRGQSMAQHLAESSEEAVKETARARH